MDLKGAAELQNQIPHCGVSPYRLKSQKAHYLLPPHPQPTQPGPARPSYQGNIFRPLRAPDEPFLGLSSVFFGSSSPSLPVQALCPPCSHGMAGCLRVAPSAVDEAGAGEMLASLPCTCS